MKRAVLHAMVSSSNQIDGTSPYGQLARARAYALNRGNQVIGT
jgi:hypothetical protein